MKRRTFISSLAAAALAASFTPDVSEAADNPLLDPWPGPYGGLPPFDHIDVSMFGPAFEASMARYRAEIHAIANRAEAPTFENTLAAMEGAGRAYARVAAILDIYTSTENDAAMQKVEAQWRPRMAALSDEIIADAALFRRIEAVYQAREHGKLSAEQKRLAWFYYNRFVRQGARLQAAEKAQLSQYNQRLAALYTRFSQNELADEENYKLVLETEDDLKGLPTWLRDAAAASAKEKGLAGRWVIMNTRSSVEPFLTYSARRDLREKAWRLWVKRGDNGDAHDNNAVVAEILRLRARRARLLGYPTFAHWQISDAMAQTPEQAMALMMKVWPAAVARVHQEVADMKAMAEKEGSHDKIEPWDYRYYAEKVRKAKYDIDENEIKPYLQLEKMREAIFWCSGQLFGYQYREIRGIPTLRPEIRTYEVSAADGRPMGVWYFDPYARDGKNSGAWMSEYRSQERFQKEVLPVVSNNANFVKGAPDAPILISWDDATTMFHEFGHAQHGLSSNVNYPSLAGTNVARDFVEFPSQLNENWVSTPEVLRRFALHYQTGQPMSAELVARIQKAARFNQGFMTVEYLASAIVDMKLHLAGDVPIDPHRFEKETLAALGMPSEIVMRHRIPHFGHIFSSDDYAAGYYSYIWSEVLDHDAYQAFVEAGGPYDRATAKRYHDDILSVGNTIDSAIAYRNFRGHDPSIEPYLRFRGFPTS